MLIDVLKSTFQRDLKRLQREIESYERETDIWKLVDGINNSAGTLVLHLEGNLKCFIGAQLGHSGYVRNREQEFSERDVPREILIERLEETKSIIQSTLKNISEIDLQREFPIQVFGEPMTTEFFLVHLGTHLNYHLGQVSYHRRILDK